MPIFWDKIWFAVHCKLHQSINFERRTPCTNRYFHITASFKSDWNGLKFLKFASVEQNSLCISNTTIWIGAITTAVADKSFGLHLTSA